MHRAGRRQLRLHLVGVVVGETSRPQVCLAFPRPPSSFWTSHTPPAIVRHVIALIIANAFWAAGATAQSISPNRVFGRYQQINWQERDGLPQNTVIAIATTRDGYLWLGTYEGAVRFDGVRFTLFNPSTTTGIGNSFVTSLLERRDGSLWLATYGGGMSRLSGGQFTQYAARDGLSSDFIMCLFEDHTGTLWIGTDGGGVNAFSQGRFTTYTTAPWPAEQSRASHC